MLQRLIASRLITPPAIWGKLTGHADFVRSGMRHGESQGWQPWLAQQAQQAQPGSPGAHLDPNLALPTAFVLPPGTLDFARQRFVLGVITPSMDKVGRPHALLVYHLAHPRWIRAHFERQARQPCDWLFWLARAVARHMAAPGGADISALERTVQALWRAHAPGAAQLCRARARPLDPDTEARGQAAPRLLDEWAGPAPVIDAAAQRHGVRFLPWADWPQRLHRGRGEASFWQQDAVGRYVNAAARLPTLWGEGRGRDGLDPVGMDQIENEIEIGNEIDTAAAPLRLRLLHRHGVVRPGVLAMAPGGTGLAPALELGGGERLSETQWHSANRCRLVGQGADWQVLNDSPTLVCAVNGERVTAAHPRAVSVGDTLELGLLRWVVEGRRRAGVGSVEPAEPAGPVGPVGPAAAQPAAVAAPDASPDDPFDWRDLATPDRHTLDHPSDDLSDDPAMAGRPLDDPFGVLDIAGARQRPVGDPLAELLGERPPRAPGSAGSDVQPSPAAAHGTDVYADADGASPGTATGKRPASPDARLFEALHEEFARVVRDPAQLTGRTQWEGPVAGARTHVPTLDELSQAAAPFALLLDIVQPSERLDQILGQFDSSAPATWLDAAPTEDVLRLFAPELARGARAALPRLTRREHHDLSPDSHMDLGVFRADDAASSASSSFAAAAAAS